MQICVRDVRDVRDMRDQRRRARWGNMGEQRDSKVHMKTSAEISFIYRSLQARRNNFGCKKVALAQAIPSCFFALKSMQLQNLQQGLTSRLENSWMQCESPKQSTSQRRKELSMSQKWHRAQPSCTVSHRFSCSLFTSICLQHVLI